MRRLNSHTQIQKFSACPAGAVFPVVDQFTVSLPGAVWGYQAGDRLTFRPCDAFSADNTYLTLEGEMVVMQAIGRDAVAIRRPVAPEQIVSRREASKMVSAERTGSTERPSLHAALTDPSFVALASSMSPGEFRVLVAEMVVTAMRGDRA